MQLHPTSRPRRVRRLIAVSAAAVAVMIAPTACDYGGAAQLDLPTHAGHTDGMNMDPQERDVVPVGQTVATTPSAEADAAETTAETAARVASERRRGDGDRRRDGDRRGRNRPVRATIPPPAGEAPAPAAPAELAAPTEAAQPAATDSAAPTAPATAALGAVPPGGEKGDNNGLEVLGRDCTNSNLPPHDGFQESPACVSTAMGEVAAEKDSPSLLITKAPDSVEVGQAFQLQVSTRNLVRNRFLGAAVGGYYLESSFLDDAGLQRGHFHTACRILPSTTEAPDAAPAPAFFVATQDNGGGAAPDLVTIDVPATATEAAGILQCTSWAGDGSHRTPMMKRANQTPAMDSVRITVGGAAQPVQNVDQAEAQQDAAAQADAQQQEAAQQADQDGAAPAQQDEATAEATATATEAAAETREARIRGAESTTAAAEESEEDRAGN